MITAEAWWNVLGNYNEFIMPFQFIWMGIALLLTIWFFIKPEKLTTILLKIYLILSFAFIAIVFFAIHGQELPAFIAQTICFGSLSLLFTIDLKLNKFQFRIPEKSASKIVMIVALLSVYLYPVVGLLSGHIFPKLIFLGTFPCPTTAFALIFAATSLPKMNLEWQNVGYYATWLLLLIWAIPFPIAIQIPQFGAYEDIIMLVIGVSSCSLIICTLIQRIKEKRIIEKSALEYS